MQSNHRWSEILRNLPGFYASCEHSRKDFGITVDSPVASSAQLQQQSKKSPNSTKKTPNFHQCIERVKDVKMKTVLLHKPMVLTWKTVSSLINPSPKKETEELVVLKICKVTGNPGTV